MHEQPPAPAPSSLPPGSGAPREIRVVERYLPDPSLRYARVAFAGRSPASTLMLAAVFAVAFGAAAYGALQLVLEPASALQAPWWLAAAPLVVVLLRPLRDAVGGLRLSGPLVRSLGAVDLGFDRAVVQAGVSFRYEVHLAAARATELRDAHVRLVFWESWLERRRVRWLGLRVRRLARHGHDLVRHEAGSVSLQRGQHAVVRGEILVPAMRPTEHHRGAFKHQSYVNVTVTLFGAAAGRATAARADAPQLITFPWM